MDWEILILVILIVIVAGGILYFLTKEEAPIVEKPKVLSISELLENPVYDTEVKIYGKVSLLGELLCPCFELTSGGEKIMVWYNLIIEDEGTEKPSVSIEGIENGDSVVVTGEFKREGRHISSNDFWASLIEKTE